MSLPLRLLFLLLLFLVFILSPALEAQKQPYRLISFSTLVAVMDLSWPPSWYLEYSFQSLLTNLVDDSEITIFWSVKPSDFLYYWYLKVLLFGCDITVARRACLVILAYSWLSRTIIEFLASLEEWVPLGLKIGPHFDYSVDGIGPLD